MKTESLVGISLELMDELEAPGMLPADARVGRFFRRRRYLGSRDRKQIGAAAWAWLRYRDRARLGWDVWSGEPGQLSLEDLGARHSRLCRLAECLVLSRDGLLPWSLDELRGIFGTLRRPLDEVEEAKPDRGVGVEPQQPDTERDAAFWGPLTGSIHDAFAHADLSPPEEIGAVAAALSLPVWLARRLVEERGPDEARLLGEALLKQAPVDLRVNLRRMPREEVRKALEKELGVKVELTRYSPAGLRLGERKNLTSTRANRQGWMEVADQGSQVVVRCLDVGPGATVIDACAGAGGKTLALADLLDLGFRRRPDSVEGGSEGEETFLPPGAIFACDTSMGKLEELARRASEAEMTVGVTILEVEAEGPLPAELPRADLVLVDAPCSGLGTLRRNPELKGRYSEDDVAAFSRQQRGILERFADLVKPGGRLAYVTCSLLRQENEAVAEAFSEAHPDFEPSPSEWAAARLPPACLDGHVVRLDPVRSETDGFFLAMWRRSQEP